MKPATIIILVLLIAIIIYLYMISKKAKEYSLNNPATTNYNYGAIGLSLANLIANTKCGKEGRPPCTKQELQASGWSDEQISQAEAGSNSASSATNAALCALGLGVNC